MPDNEPVIIEAGSEVLMYFSLALEDGTVADCTDEGEPMRFTMGDGTLIQGLELALYGLKVGDHQSLVVGPDVGFGFRDDEAIQILPRSDFPAEMDLEPGLIIGFSTPSGEEVPGAIVDIEGDDVHVDFNHPLAGHNVRFDVEILEVKPPAAG